MLEAGTLCYNSHFHLLDCLQREAEERLARAKQAEQWEAASPAGKRARPESASQRDGDGQVIICLSLSLEICGDTWMP